MPKLLQKLKVQVFESDDKLIGPCPIHGGDNPCGFNVNIDPQSEWCGAWFCNTNQCHTEYPNDSIGLIQGILSRKHNREVSFMDTIKYLESQISIDKNFKHIPQADLIEQIFKKKASDKVLCKRKRILDELLIPCPYFIERGFSKEVLEEFSVGFCNNPDKPMYRRSVFPIFNPRDLTSNEVIGVVGRSIEPNPQRKWKFSKGFSAGKNLFNYTKAYERMKRTSSAILVEGQGDVVRLYESGAINSVGIFGCDLNDEQSILLERASVQNLILILDNDHAGDTGRDKIIQKYHKMFNIVTVDLDRNDIGDMSVEEVQSKIFTQIGKYI